MDLIADVYHFLANLDAGRAIRIFWLFFLFDLPRYVLTDVYVLIEEFLRRRLPQRCDGDFEFRLRHSPPRVSVIVPVLNEERTISWTIRSLREQTYPDLEIIVVDDGSEDGTEAICRRECREHGIMYHRLDRRIGKSAALNLGLRTACGEYVVFVDSDTTFDRDAIFEIVRPFEDPKVGAVAGNLAVRNRHTNLLTELQALEYIFSISVGRIVRARLGILPVVSGAFGAFRRDLVGPHGLGGHEPGPGNDSDLTIRVRKEGYRIAFARRALCLTHVPDRFATLIRQRWRWDRNLIKNRLRKHRDVFNPAADNFRLRDVVSFLDTIFFHVVLAVLTVVYVFDLAYNYPRMLPFLLLVNFVLYFCAELVELLCAAALMRDERLLRHLVYLPLFNPYKVLLKYFRVIGYVQELVFERSFHDTFAPGRVRAKMVRW